MSRSCLFCCFVPLEKAINASVFSCLLSIFLGPCSLHKHQVLIVQRSIFPVCVLRLHSSKTLCALRIHVKACFVCYLYCFVYLACIFFARGCQGARNWAKPRLWHGWHCGPFLGEAEKLGTAHLNTADSIMCTPLSATYRTASATVLLAIEPETLWVAYLPSICALWVSCLGSSW